MAWKEYVNRYHREEGVQSTTGRKGGGVSQTTVSRWLRGARPSFQLVLAFARGYRGNVLEALVAAEFLTPEEAGALPGVVKSHTEVVDAEPNLSPEVKTSLKTQFRTGVVAFRVARLQQMLEHDSTLDPVARAQLLVALTELNSED